MPTALQLPLDAVPAVLAAIRTTLLSDVTLPGLLAGLQVVVEAPASAPTPYIQMAARSQDWSCADQDGQQVSIDLHVWHEPRSQTPETGVVMQIMTLCRQLLHTASPSLAEPFHLVQMRVETSIGPYRDPDGSTIHGVVTVRMLVDHT